jgi:hypothetical protein
MKKQTMMWLITIGATCVIIIGLSAIFFTWRAYTYYQDRCCHYSGNSFIVPDPVIGYRARPNSIMGFPTFTVYTDNRGGREPRPGMIAPSKVDVLSIGCSFAWGHGVQDEDTYIKKIGVDLGVTTFNAALASYGTTTALLSLKHYADLRPKVVIYGFIADHINRSLDPCAACTSGLCRGVAHVGFDAQGHPIILKPHTSPLYYENLQQIIMEHKFGLNDIKWEIIRDLDLVPKWEPVSKKYTKSQIRSAMKFLMDDMYKESHKIGAKLVVVYIPLPRKVTGPPKVFMEAISDLIKNKDITFVNLTQPFEKATKDGVVLANKNDGHPNAIAHSIIAHKLEQVIPPLLK